MLSKTKNITNLALSLFKYNVKVIFANKFIYFFLGALAFFGFIITISLLEDPRLDEAIVYGFLLFPGILIIFYPTIYGLQNDDDSKMLEIIFGIPNYRYKVWLLRFVIILIVAILMLIFLGIIAKFALFRINIFSMVLQVMFPITFMTSLGFMMSTLVKNGNGTAITMVILGILFLIFYEPLEYNSWNIFLNPYIEPRDMSETIWYNVIFKNRIYLVIGSIISLLYALFNLQYREKFVS